MPTLNLQLFGPGVLTLDGEPVRTHSAKTLALLAFLVLEPGRPHARERLASLLWGRQSEQAARQSLRQALHSLKTLAGGALNDRIVADRDRVAFAPGPGVDVDAIRFLDDVRGTDARAWRAAAECYRAPLLEGRSFEGADEFEQWLAVARERLHAHALQNLDRLVADHVCRSDWDTALGFARSLRDLDPTSEVASRHLLRIFAARQEPDAIDAEWTRLSRALKEAFGAEPSAATGELRRALLGYGAAAGAPAAAAGPGSGGTASGAGAARVPGDAEPFVRAARAAERVHAFNQAADLYDRALGILEHCAPAVPRRWHEVLLLKEATLERLGRRAEQIATIDRALAIAAPLGDDALLASALLRKAGACAYVGDHVEAARAAGRALELSRACGDAPGEAEALRELGFVQWHAGDLPAALQSAREALALHRRLGDVTGEASALHNLAEIHRELGSPRQAMEGYEQALRLHWAARNHEGEILTLFGMANALWQVGDPSGAMRRYDDALALSERHGERTMQSRALHALATRHADRNDLDAALALMRRAIELDRAIGYAHGLGHDLVDLARIHVERGERAEALATLTEATVWFGFTENRDALEATRAWIGALESGARTLAPRETAWPHVKSHLTLGEGKVYCAFESPGARMRH